MQRRILFLILALFLPSSVFAVPPYLSHQGRILQSDQVPVTGIVILDFSIYEQAEGGNPVWSETLETALDNGFYSVTLGTDQSLEDISLDNGLLYLGINIDNWGELDPRTELSSVPYAFTAGAVNGHVDGADGLWINGEQVADENGQWIGASMSVWRVEDSLISTDSSVIIGETSEATLEVEGEIKISSTGMECLLETAGTLRWFEEKLEVCNGEDWMIIYGASPTISSVNPGTGSEHGGMNMIVSGSNFANGSTVKFGSVGSPAVQYDSSSQMTVVVPALSPGNYHILVTSPSGQSGNLANGWTAREDLEPVWNTEPGNLGTVFDEPTATVIWVQATDPEGDPIFYSIIDGFLPLGLELDPSNGSIRGNAENVEQNSTFDFTIRATSTFTGVEQYTDQLFSIIITPARDGTAPERAGADCKTLLDNNFSIGDGPYWINPNQGSTDDAYQVYCDMTSNGGGWVLVMQIQADQTTLFGYDSEYWYESNTFNESVPDSLSNINAKYGAFNIFETTDGYLMFQDKSTGNQSVLRIPGMAETTLLDRFQTLGGGSDRQNPGSTLILVAGRGSPQELMGYETPTAMCSESNKKWRFNLLSSQSGVRIGNDVATNDQITNNPSNWPCIDNRSNLAYSGVGGSLGENREWQDSYGSESLDRYLNRGTGQGSQKGVSIFVR